jgi:hypothetical protein
MSSKKKDEEKIIKTYDQLLDYINRTNKPSEKVVANDKD